MSSSLGSDIYADFARTSRDEAESTEAIAAFDEGAYKALHNKDTLHMKHSMIRTLCI